MNHVFVKSYTIAVIFALRCCVGGGETRRKQLGKRGGSSCFIGLRPRVFFDGAFVSFTLGANGEFGRSFLADLAQAESPALGSAFLGGVVFNIANILLVAAIAIAGMSVAFPVGIGLALILGVALNYFADQSGNPYLLGGGVLLVALAIVFNAVAYEDFQSLKNQGEQEKGTHSALLWNFDVTFYYFVAASLAKVEVLVPTAPVAATAVAGTAETAGRGDCGDCGCGDCDGGSGELKTELKDVTAANSGAGRGETSAGKLTAVTPANVVFALGVLLSSFFVVTFVQLKPFVGTPVSPLAYFGGTCKEHFWGLIGGAIWAVGMTLNVVAAGVASPAISYGLGQGATLVAAIWGVFIWKEFRDAKPGTSKLFVMFLFLPHRTGNDYRCKNSSAAESRNIYRKFSK